ncbi:MAG TPA: hypothetical protein VK797_22155 [Tepidisphaeraceae bacterium]|jgi:hypothetical protein|nr:hypothetical protein [Tepidisphaeraceae bacterium]
MSAEQIWAIGIYGGKSPLTLAPQPTVKNPVLKPEDVTDVNASFVADPFIVNDNGTWYMFFEIGSKEQDRIGLATSGDAVHWTYRQVVLNADVRLSYPHVFLHEGDYYMIPESHKAHEVRLYRARDFPLTWEIDTVLLREPFVVDSSPFQHNGRWWMFANCGPPENNQTLNLYYACDLRGPWQAHPQNPLNESLSEARPAGRVIQFDRQIVRLGQDCKIIYGQAVRGFEVRKLTERDYQEQRIDPPLLGPSGVGWNAGGMHHLDAHKLDDGNWIAAVDGF